MLKRKRTNFIISKLEGIADSLERSGIDELISYRKDTRKYIKVSFVGGLFRGLGMSVGITILGALLVMLLSKLAEANLPLIGGLIAEIVKIVKSQS